MHNNLTSGPKSIWINRISWHYVTILRIVELVTKSFDFDMFLDDLLPHHQFSLRADLVFLQATLYRFKCNCHLRKYLLYVFSLDWVDLDCIR